jgi:hypothetical protein
VQRVAVVAERHVAVARDETQPPAEEPSLHLHLLDVRVRHEVQAVVDDGREPSIGEHVAGLRLDPEDHLAVEQVGPPVVAHLRRQHPGARHEGLAAEDVGRQGGRRDLRDAIS